MSQTSELSEEEIAQRRDAAIFRALTTPARQQRADPKPPGAKAHAQRQRRTREKTEAAELNAFVRKYDVKEILSPRFVRLVGLAHAEGLLARILSDDLVTAERHAAALITRLSATLHRDCRISHTHTPMLQDGDRPDVAP
jgi:hypothetical protein